MSRYLRSLEASVLAATLIALPAAASAQTSTTEKAKEKVKETTQAAKTGVTDTWITSKAKIALFADERVSGTQVRVETTKGTVRLYGKVDTPEAKAAAESVAKGIDGVKSVKNDLQVVAPAQRKAVDADDKQISKSVETKLKKEAQLKKVDVRADAGVVTLTGQVPSVSASARASELARQVPGVRSVKNELTERRG
jgi:hyperosmotically inducible protein